MKTLDSGKDSCDERPMTIEVKICGLKTEEAVNAALDAGATHIGFIFFDKSPRNIDPETAGRLRELATGRAKVVAVSVDADDARLDRIVERVKPDLLQLHGKETPERVAELRRRYRLPVMKAFSLRERDDLETIEPYVGIADRFLFDAKPPAGSQLPGGNGVAFDWHLLSGLDRRIDYMLSGGLNADNIAQAVDQTGTTGIDVSSGVESAPGVKETGLIAKFFKAVAATDRPAGSKEGI
jgi:phosphoribosylanthranilate isomerase